MCNNAAERVSSGVSGVNSNLDILESIKHTEKVHIQNDLIALTTTYRNIHNNWKEV